MVVYIGCCHCHGELSCVNLVQLWGRNRKVHIREAQGQKWDISDMFANCIVRLPWVSNWIAYILINRVRDWNYSKNNWIQRPVDCILSIPTIWSRFGAHSKHGSLQVIPPAGWRVSHRNQTPQMHGVVIIPWLSVFASENHGISRLCHEQSWSLWLFACESWWSFVSSA